MPTLLKDFYSITCQFSMKLSRERGFDAASEYARHMCALWFFLVVVLGVEIVTLSLGIPVSALIGKTRVWGIVATIILLVAGNFLAKAYIAQVPEFRTHEGVQKHYEKLSSRRRMFVVGLATGNLVTILLIVAARQFWGLFGGL